VIRFVLGLMPWWGWLLLGGIGTTTLVVYHLQALHHVRVQVRAEMRAEIAERDAEALRLANTANARVTDGYHQQIRTAGAAAARARTDLQRVRDELTQQAAATGAGTDASAAAARQLLGECVGLLGESAATAGGLSAQVRGLQSYINDVCLNERVIP
jgi:Tfp pilus assembly protein PilV